MCVECAEKIVTSETDCSSLNCSVVSIDPVEMEQYFIGGEYFKDRGYSLLINYP